MPDSENRDTSGAGKNEKTVAVLRETFAAITKRLTPEVESATIYLAFSPISDADSSLGSSE
jgi:hypothetical protein